MHIQSILSIFACTACGAVFTAAAAEPLYRDATAPVESRVADLLSRMTVDEKIGQLYQSIAEADWRPMEPQFDLVRKGGVGSFINLYRDRTTPDKADSPERRCHDALQKVAVEESRLGIPLIFGHDVIHGCYTAFPTPLTLACSFDPSLFERAQHCAAREARWAGYDWTFTPMCDTARDPRWGRVAETCGEDPYLNALCVAAQVRGLQGADVTADDRIPACMKHFVGYSDVAGGRDYNVTECSEWTLRNLHLVPFRACVEAGVETVMSSFNTVDGIPACTSRHTLTDILRGEWGFTGFVVSDWNAVHESIVWGYAKDGAAAARLAVHAGNDMEMFSPDYVNNLRKEIEAGRLAGRDVDVACANVLRVKFRTGLFERPYAREVPKGEAYAKAVDAAHAVARECAAKSAVLLENDGTLPLAAKRVALVGPMALDREKIIGCWADRADPARTDLATELKRALGAGVELSVAKGCAINTAPATRTAEDGKVVVDKAAVANNALDAEGVRAAVAKSDVVVVAVGEDSAWTGENHSRSELTLTGRQQELFDLVATLGKPVVTVVFSGRPLTLPAVWEKSAAVIYAFQPGCEGAAALADILAGRVAPEGRLSMSVPRDVSQVPVYYNSYSTGRPDFGRYDGVEKQDAKYPFGRGLSYTTFAYGPTTVADGVAKCTVTNTGTRAGVETAQLYVRAWSCEGGVRPARELRGFRKLSLKPGESAEVAFALDDAALRYTDRSGTYRVDAGRYSARIAPDAVSGKAVDFYRN